MILFFLDTKEGADSTIDGENYVKQIPYSLKSPFVNCAWDDSKVTISFKEEKHILDFAY
jgi:hypothetical protein